MRFSPFDKGINDVDPSELGSLKKVHEGWFVEYKSQLPKPRRLAKSLAAFANQYGGWLFIGVEEESTMTAGGFPGIPNEELPQVLETLRNAAKDLIRPVVFFQERIYSGPIEEIGLDSNHSLVAVYVPEGPETPYVHNDGRLYIRIGDSSSPVHADDRATFDLLFRRGEGRRQRLESLIDRIPTISKAEENEPFLHLAILTDPYETLGHRYTGSFPDFCEIMSSNFIPFDNFFSASDGFVARQAAKNDRYFRVPTWEYSRNGHSFVTIPVPNFSPVNSDRLNDVDGSGFSTFQDSVAERFRRIVSESNLGNCRILDLTDFLFIIGAVFRRHRTIMEKAGISAPLHTKVHLENVWRTVPFIELPEYLKHVEKYDIPLVQTNEIEIPPSSSSLPCVVFPELNGIPREPEPYTEDGPLRLGLRLVEALGIPGYFIAANSTELLEVSKQRRRV
ncbi:MAG: ATP-binding protein [Caldilineaceae bacterium]|nr:ATP-binding protein [Caldilineaceae bacterium]